MQGYGQSSGNRNNNGARNLGFVGNTNPVASENSALADELRRILKGKPTISGFNRSLRNEIIAFLASVIRIGLVAVLCAAFVFGLSDYLFTLFSFIEPPVFF